MSESDLSKAGPISSPYEFIPDPDEETVEIPVEIKNGKVRFKTGTADEDSEPLPDLEDGTTGTLTVLASALENDEDYQQLAGELLEIILPSTVLIWFKIKTEHSEWSKIPEYGKAYLNRHDLPSTGGSYHLIPSALREHLWLHHRGMKDPQVQPSRCSIPEQLQSKGEEDVSEVLPSLHQAYMGLSEIFEKQRSTHGGNVYTKGYFWNPIAEDWEKLDFFRERRPQQCIWMGEDREWLRPFWVKPEEPSTTAWGGIDDHGRWRAHSPVLSVPDSGERSLKQVSQALDRKGYRPYDPLRDRPPLRAKPEEQNWDAHWHHWGLESSRGRETP